MSGNARQETEKRGDSLEIRTITARNLALSAANHAANPAGAPRFQFAACAIRVAEL